jgi:ribose transport system ATP-binding protein
VRGVFKSFGGTEALADVGMILKAGEILALLGENGAGKSTLIKILAGVYALDAGQVSFRGVDVTHALRRLPIAFIHQDLGLIDWMTVAENICMTLGFPRRLGMIDADAARRRAAVALDALGADIDPDARIQNLSRTEKSLVAIARALAAEPEILVLDEPTASLPADEVARLFSALRRLRAHGVAMIYVSHRLDEVFEIADRMVVLRDGRVAGEREVAKTTPDETILLIVGREPSQVFRRPPDRHGSPRLALRSVMVEAVGPVDCTIDSGEIVGLVGLRGAGQESVGRALFGVWPVTGGQVLLDGRQMTVATPREAMAQGVNLICADRVGESIMPNLSVRENLFLNPVAAGLSAFSLISPGRESQVAKERGAQLGLRPNDPSLPIELLSGRQPTEGGGRALAAPRRLDLRHRGSHRRRRRRRQGGNLSPLRCRAQAGRGHLHRIDRLRGGRQGLSSRADLRPGPRRRRARRGRSVGGESARGRLRQHTALRAASRRLRRCPGRRRACSPLNRTPSSRRGRNWRGFRLGEGFCGWRRSTGFPF